MVDVELGNWFTSTHPRSPFVTGLIVSAQRRDGSRTSLSDWNGLALTEQTPEETTVTPVEHASVGAMLDEQFGLMGFALASDGRLGLAATSRPAHHLR